MDLSFFGILIHTLLHHVLKDIPNQFLASDSVFLPMEKSLLSSSLDQSAIIWDTVHGNQIASIQFDAPIVSCQPHPTRSNEFIFSLENQLPIFVRITHEGPKHISQVAFSLVLRSPFDSDDPVASPPPISRGNTREPGSRYVTQFSIDGSLILRGNSSGLISVFEVGDKSVEFREDLEVPGRAMIKMISFSPCKTKWCINSQDRVIRLYNTDVLDASKADKTATKPRLIEHQLVIIDVVNRVQWQCVCFSQDGDYLAVGLQDSSHKITIHRTSDGMVEKVLEGPKESIGTVLWHPMRAVLITVGLQYGGVYMWSKNYTENWSAFAPNFEELEENAEHSESESEFDKKTEADIKAMKEQIDAQEARLVDIMNDTPGQSLLTWFDDCPYYCPPVLINTESSELQNTTPKKEKVRSENKRKRTKLKEK